MLSRTASELFWMARYLERAESYARVLDVTEIINDPPPQPAVAGSGATAEFVDDPRVVSGAPCPLYHEQSAQLFALDGNNPCSIYSCVEMAWNNAHAVRGSLSAEVWESINATRIELRTLRQQGLGELGSDGFFEWVKERVHLFRGAVIGTLLRNDALSFIGIGTLIERAFATTQLLLIKDQQLTNDPDPVREYYRLDTLLNAVSAREAYNSLYRQPVSRETVMELLILRNDIPRSLRASIADPWASWRRSPTIAPINRCASPISSTLTCASAPVTTGAGGPADHP
ncbi:alpha-E domain-containing protein [Klebsiella pneumoniae]